MSRLGSGLVASLVLLTGRLRRKPPATSDVGRIVPEGPPEPRAELTVALLLLASALCAVAFVVFYALDRLPAQTQLLGASIGFSLAFMAAALITVGKRLVVTEELTEDYPEENPEAQEELTQIVHESGDRITRKRLLLGAGGVAGGALGLAAITPLVSLGPVFDTSPFYSTPWLLGRRLVDERGRPYHADDIEEADFYTAYPEHADKEQFGAPLVVVRVDPRTLQLPAGRRHWAPDGILAYSKICTHAGCAISIYRTPLFQPVEPRPALVCPCHYSTFDPTTGGKVLFGPAGRDLPQLPLTIDGTGELRAGGNFSGPVGPSWWGVRLRGPKP